jgi:hypothetical protein
MQMVFACLKTCHWLSHWLHVIVLPNRAQEPPRIFCVSCSHHRTCGLGKHSVRSCLLDGKTTSWSTSIISGQFNSCWPSCLMCSQNPYWHCSPQSHGVIAQPDISFKLPSNGVTCMFIRTYTSCTSFQQTTLTFLLTDCTIHGICYSECHKSSLFFKAYNIRSPLSMEDHRFQSKESENVTKAVMHCNIRAEWNVVSFSLDHWSLTLSCWSFLVWITIAKKKKKQSSSIVVSHGCVEGPGLSWAAMYWWK